MLNLRYNVYGDKMKIGILGTGAYGSALARVLFKNNNDITMWTKFTEEMEYIKENRFIKSMPDVILDEKIKITNDLNYTISNSDLIIVVIPSDFVYGLFEEAHELIGNKPVCIASKGIDPNKNMFLSDIAKQFGIKNIGFISGPTFAAEMANYTPCGLTIASESENVSNVIYKAFKNEDIKLEISNDIIGTQLSNTLKNIFAIVMGMLDEKNYSVSTKTLVITSLINELNNAILKNNSNSHAIISLSGIGDIWLTCTSTKSRNYTLGQIIASGNCEKIKEYLSNTTVEGYDNLKIILKLKNNYGFEFPLIEYVYGIINKNKSIDEFIKTITK